MDLPSMKLGTLVEHGRSGPLLPVRRGRPSDKSVRSPVILVADADDEAREAMREVLTDENGWSVIEAQNGAEALATTLSRSPDAVVLDYRLPGMNGLEVAEALRKAGAATPIVLMTLAKDAETVAGAGEIAHLLGKPFGFDQLTAVIARALGAS